MIDAENTDFEKQLTHETFEQVINKPATVEELNAVKLAEAVLNSSNRQIIIKKIVHDMIAQGWSLTLETYINEAVINNPLVDDRETICLDIKLKE